MKIKVTKKVKKKNQNFEVEVLDTLNANLSTGVETKFLVFTDEFEWIEMDKCTLVEEKK